MSARLTKLITAAAVAVTMASGSAYAAAKTVKLGSHVPLTGKLARVGNGMHEGIAVAIKEANKQYEGQYKFEVSTVDDETSPAKAVAAVDKLANDGVVAFTGGYGSNIVGPASEEAHKLKLPYITSGAVAPELVKRGYSDFYRINNLGGYSRAMSGLIKDMGLKSVSVLYSNKEGPTGLALSLEKQLKAAGVTVHLHKFDANTNDFKPLLNRIKLQDRPEGLVMDGYENDYVGILRAGKVLKPNVKAVIGPWSLATSKMNKEFNALVQNVYGTSMLPYPVRFTGPEAEAFEAAYKKMWNKQPDYLGEFGYVQTRILIDAIVRADRNGGISHDNIVKQMHKVDTKTLIGRVAFNEGGDNPYFTNRMGQHQGHKVEIVWPASAATAKMNFPASPWSH